MNFYVIRNLNILISLRLRAFLSRRYISVIKQMSAMTVVPFGMKKTL